MFFFFFKISDLLYGAQRQTMVSTQYLLIYEKRLYKERRKVENRETMKEKKKRKRLGDRGCTFAPRSHTMIEPYPLSKLNTLGLSTRR